MSDHIPACSKIIREVCTYFADSASSLVPECAEEIMAAREAGDTDRAMMWVRRKQHLERAAECLGVAAAELNRAREGA